MLSSLAFANEVSVFGAGDLNSNEPYGLNSTEKYILKNKNELGKIDTKFKGVKTTLETVSERIDGLESIYEGDSQKLNKTVITLNKIVKQIEEIQNTTSKNKTDIENLKNVTNQLLTMQEEISSENRKNLDTLKEAIDKLSKQLIKINKEYVSFSEMKKNMKQFVTVEEFNAFKETLGKKTSVKTKSTTKTKKLSYAQKEEMLNEAKELFKKDYFTKAIPIFEELVELNFKPAESNYYLGEMWYYRDKFEKAIDYFKKSAVLYDKASWMPRLLLHSAISFENIKDYKNATKFYSTLIDVYPNSKEAKIATKNISKL
ncbi:TolA-binding protein [Malaciobacter marinus]|jgi:TolA-binding protein|uniref:TolA-binding protein n=2 Tax=Malaciobacter marinus TaxID=505249 RepID=A0AB36ZWY1_9BACT|nr:TolA-binding protein [Malaciobacter marinus]SKB62771.1 TolA-binding protein [Malaciobacter marinus]